MGKLKRVSMGILLAILFVIPFCLVPIITIPIPCIITSVSAESNKSSKNNPGKKSFKERMCSTITDFLQDKMANTKKGSNTSKILQGSLKEVNGLCGKGIIPQVSEIKGLSPKDKEILNKKTENALKKFYDGAGNLPDEDFDGTKLKSSKTGSGTPGTTLTGDKVSDLKSSDPTLPAANSNPVPALKAAKSGSNPVPKLETSQANVSIEPKLQTAEIKGNPEIPKPTQEECDKLEQEGYDKLYQELIQECNKPGEECLKSLKEYQNRSTEAYESWQKCVKLTPYNPACEQLRQKSKELADEENKKREECNKITSEILGCQFEIVQKMTNLVQECAKEKPIEIEYGQHPLPEEAKTLLKEKVFGDSINYDEVTIERKKGSGIPSTDGKNIIIYDQYKDKDILFEGNVLTKAGEALLGHEATHIWQDQHTKFFTIKKVIYGIELVFRLVKAKSDFNPETTSEKVVNYMYNWRRSCCEKDSEGNYKIPFEKLNHEQQAQLVKDYILGNFGDDPPKKYMEDAIKKIRDKKAKK